jgi:hypothetical protein
LQFYVAGESFEGNTVNEFEFLNNQEIPFIENDTEGTENNESVETNEQNLSQIEIKSGDQFEETPQLQIEPEVTPLEKAMAAKCPISKYKDKTLQEMIRIDHNTLPYIAKNGGKYGQEIADFAKLICEHALNQVAV